MKKVGIVIISLLITVLLLVVTIGGSLGNKSNNDEKASIQSSNNQTVVTNNKGSSQYSAQKEEVVVTDAPETPKAEMSTIDSGTMSSTSSNVIDMREVNENSIPYTNKYETNYATVIRKESYMTNNQLFYTVVFNLEDNDIGEVDYFVGYSTYNSIEVGDRMMLEYEVFSNGFVSIVSISK